MLVACLLQYSDTQSYGVAAIFGLIKDLKLYTITSDFQLNLSKYQWSTSVANLGSMFVCLCGGMCPETVLTVVPGTISSSHRRPVSSSGKVLLCNGLVLWLARNVVHCL
jgi:hypothetical protein